MTAVLENPPTTPETAEQVVTLTAGQVAQHPDNLRDPGRDLDALAKSIREVGVLVPLIVVPVDQVAGDWPADVTHVAVDGNRRQAAAATVGAPLPCLVRPDVADAKATARTMAVTGLMRDGLTVIEEARAVQTMLDLGLSAASITRATGRSRDYVRKAKAAATVPDEAAQIAASYAVTIDQLADLAEFADDEDTTTQLLDVAYDPGEWAHALSVARRDRAADAAIAAKRADLEAAGVAGERIPSDGVVVTGRSSVDTSAITGESMPVEIGPGAQVFAGAVNSTGAITIETTAAVVDNSLAKVVRIVEDAQRRKGNRQRLADQIARPLVPAIMILAALIAGIGSLLGDPQVWIERALVVLVAAAPCALAISVPVTVIAAVGAASRMGLLIKGGAALEALGAVRSIALDKTGTLTRNNPAVVAVVPAPGFTEQRVLQVAAALEARSEHPLAAAILEAAPNPEAADEVTAVPGAGLEGSIAGIPARLGKAGWINAGSLDHEVQRLQEEGVTVALIELDGALLGLVGIRDELRPEAVDAVAALRSADLQVSMLTGDNERTAAALAAQVGVSEIHAGLHPTDKAALIDRFRTERRGGVAMVGLSASASSLSSRNQLVEQSGRTVGSVRSERGSDTQHRHP